MDVTSLSSDPCYSVWQVCELDTICFGIYQCVGTCQSLSNSPCIQNCYATSGPGGGPAPSGSVAEFQNVESCVCTNCSSGSPCCI